VLEFEELEAQTAQNFEELIEQIEQSENGQSDLDGEEVSDIETFETETSKPSVTEISRKLYPDENDQDFLFNLVDEVHEKGLTALEEKEEILKNYDLCAESENIEAEEPLALILTEEIQVEEFKPVAPLAPGIIFRVDRGANTFCVRGFTTENINYQLKALPYESAKLMLLKAQNENDQIFYFETKTFEVAEIIKDQIINRRFPIQEDAVCNISDPGYSWWMDVTPGRFEIHFKSNSIQRAEKFVKLGPVGDSKIAMLRLNQAHALLRSSFPLTEFSCTDKSLVVATSKPDHSSFLSFQNIFLNGDNYTCPENFPDNSTGKTLYFYFLELATLRKFWIEVEAKLS
ncbi:MAG: hypothetical protein L6Q33_08445, partial [Bacteriovoracaceae bacterium]|nr:hypothetical protein [Bacteriovoracaceae bacterium]